MRLKSLDGLPPSIRKQVEDQRTRLPAIVAPAPSVVVSQSAKNARFEDEFEFQCKAFGLPPFKRRYRFAESMGRQFEADFAFIDLMLLVEVNGGIWKKGGGAHSHPLDILRDIERQQYAVLLGFFVLPVTTDEVTKGAAIHLVRRAIESLRDRNKLSLGMEAAT